LFFFVLINKYGKKLTHPRRLKNLNTSSTKYQNLNP
jgi:hypothetical protein